MKPSTPPPEIQPEGIELAEDIADVITRLSLVRSIAEVCEIVPRAARRLTGAEGSTFVLKEQQQYSYVGEEVIGSEWEGRLFPEGEAPGWWAQQTEAMRIADVDDDERIPHSVHSETLIRSLVMVPVGRETPVGTISICWAESQSPSDEQMRILQALGDATAVILDNILLREKMEQLVQERTAALQAVNDELETFAYTISHDLKNPLSVMKTNCWSLREMFGPELSEKSLRCVGRIEEAADRMRDQIDGMLSMYRVSKAPLEPVLVDLGALGKEIVDGLRELDPERKAAIDIGRRLEAAGDERMLRVVLENLLGNAWKYTAKRETAEIEFDAFKDEEGNKVFYVRDNGAGFDMARADKLFSVFQRMHRDEEFGGTGVGLASVQRILNKHGGRIWAHAEVDDGATFYFTLPAVPVLVELSGIDLSPGEMSLAAEPTAD